MLPRCDAHIYRTFFSELTLPQTASFFVVDFPLPFLLLLFFFFFNSFFPFLFLVFSLLVFVFIIFLSCLPLHVLLHLFFFSSLLSSHYFICSSFPSRSLRWIIFLIVFVSYPIFHAVGLGNFKLHFQNTANLHFHFHSDQRELFRKKKSLNIFPSSCLKGKIVWRLRRFVSYIKFVIFNI